MAPLPTITAQVIGSALLQERMTRERQASMPAQSVLSPTKRAVPLPQGCTDSVLTQPMQAAAGESMAHRRSADCFSGIVTEPPTTPLPWPVAASTASASSQGIFSYTNMPLKPRACARE